MKKSMFGLVACLALVLSLVVAQGVWAGSCNVTVSGEVTAIYNDTTIEVGEAIVYGVPLTYLAKKLGIALKETDYVVVTASPCPNTGQLSACTIAVNGGATITLPGTRTR
jgi:hypothetical protein